MFCPMTQKRPDLPAGSISRRKILAAVPALPVFWGTACAAAAKPYEARIFSAGFDGSVYQGGLHIVMNPGWKTYWRVPGAGGIPPSIEVQGGNIAAFAFSCPLPQRIASEDGEAIGYKDEVIFPWTLTPADRAVRVQAAVSAFVGICETVCIPVPVAQDLALEPVGVATRETALLAGWQAKVPRQGTIVSSLAAVEDDGVFIDVALSRPAKDVFVEGSAMHFFLPPVWSDGQHRARLKVNGAKSAGELRNKPLRMTFVTQGGEAAGGLEQTVTVS